MRGLGSIVAWSLVLVVAVASDVRAGTEAAASNSLTVLTSGPRAGESGKRYFNIQGKKNEKYASFGILDFSFPAPSPDAGRPKTLTLTLVQSIPRFAKDGKIKVYLIGDPKSEDKDASLKFDPSDSDGLGGQFRAKHPLGTARFAKVETGHVETLALTLDEEGRDSLRDQLAKRAPVRLVIVPDDDDVAATYFGSGGADPSTRPKLSIEVAP